MQHPHGWCDGSHSAPELWGCRGEHPPAGLTNTSSSSNLVFPGGLPSRYWPGLTLLSFSGKPVLGYRVIWLLTRKLMAAVERETRRNLLAKRCLHGCSSPAEVWRERGWRRGVVGDRCLTAPTGPGFRPLISSAVCAGCHRNGPLHVKPWTFCIRSTTISWI